MTKKIPMKINLPNEVYQKIMYWVQRADFEVSGMGNCTYDDQTKTFTVHDAVLVEQEGTGGSTDISAAALARAMYEMRALPGQLSFWWHSHVDMKAFMSGTDVATCKDLGGNGYCIAAVFNRRCEYKTAIAYRTTSAFGGDEIMYTEGIPLEITQPPLAADLVAYLSHEFEAKVKRKEYPSLVSRYNTWEYSEAEWAAGAKKKKKRGKKDETDEARFDEDAMRREEARALGVTASQYERMLVTATAAELSEMDAKINSYFHDKYGLGYVP